MDKTVQGQIADFLAAHQCSLHNFCSQLVKTPSVNGVHPERAVARLLANQAQELGLFTQILAHTAERPNVLVSSSNKGPTGLILVGHLDTVPAGQVEQWTHHPFGGHIVGNKLYGRGAIDNKGGLAAALYGLAALKACNLLTNGRVQLICVPDEESGATGTLGIKFLGQQGLVSGQGAIYVYPGVSEIPVGHRGLTRYQVVAQGRAAHTGLAGNNYQRQVGQNAVTAMAALLLHLEQFDPPRSQIKYFDRYRAVISPGTVIKGGTNINIVPDRCEALIDIRTTPEFDLPEAETALQQAIAAIESKRPGITFEYKLLNYVPAALSDSSAPLFELLADVTETITGYRPEPVVCGPANEGYLFIEQGIPVVCGFGPTGANAHAVDEHLDLDSLIEAALIYALTAVAMDKTIE